MTTSKVQPLDSYVSVKGVTYHVRTALIPNKSPFIITNAFINKTVVESTKLAIPMKREIPIHIMKKLMRQEHEKMTEKLQLKHVAADTSQAYNMRKIRRHISAGRLKDALTLAEDTLLLYPGNPPFMSFHGYLKAAVRSELKEGLDVCKKALELFQSEMKDGDETYLSHFYLNIGRVYILSGKKDLAITAFNKGLKCDSRNKEIIIEFARLGPRRPPPIPYLDRGHPVNKYLGLFFSKAGVR